MQIQNLATLDDVLVGVTLDGYWMTSENKNCLLGIHPVLHLYLLLDTPDDIGTFYANLYLIGNSQHHFYQQGYGVLEEI